MHTQGTNDSPRVSPSSKRYKEKLAQMQKAKTSPAEGSGKEQVSQVGIGEVNPIALATQQPKTEHSKAVEPTMKQLQVDQRPQQVDTLLTSLFDVEQEEINIAATSQHVAATSPPPQSFSPTMPPLPTQEAVTPQAATSDLDPLAGSVACVEAVIKAYSAAPPEEREAMVLPLREAMMAAARASNDYMSVFIENARLARKAAKAAKAAETTPKMPTGAAATTVGTSPKTPEPMMGFPTTYAVTKAVEEVRDNSSPAASIVNDAPSGSYDDLALAATTMDVTTVSSLIQSGLQLDEQTTDAAFWAVVKAVDRAEALDQPLSADVPTMLHHIFDADLRHLLTREQIRTNVTCMMPAQAGANRIGMNYIFDDAAHKDLPLEEGRRCEGGTCCDKCSRNIFPTFASSAETSLETYPELTGLTFNELTNVTTATILQFTRLIERVRRTIAHEYGLPLSSILPLQAYSRKYVAGTTQQGGGGGEGDFVTLHTDEATHDGYHYSCVLYLSTHEEDFEGGSFVFNDPAPKADKKDSEGDLEDEDEDDDMDYASLAEKIRTAGRVFTPYQPTRGAAVIFSSGWENMHEVEKITAGTRYCVPCFFTTCPVPEAGYEQLAQGKPKTTEDIADDWLHLLLAHREEDAHQSLGRVKELLMKWHHMCTPLSEH